jgi:hypothetical protein
VGVPDALRAVGGSEGKRSDALVRCGKRRNRVSSG